MEIVYLSNGQACYLRERIGEKYVVNKILEYEDVEGTVEVVDNTDVLVDMVFLTQPVEKISEEIKSLEQERDRVSQEIKELAQQKRTLKFDCDNLTKTQISQEKFIVNRSELINAKTLALFPKDRIMPLIMDSNIRSMRGLKIGLQISITDGEQRAWGYQLYHDYNSSGECLCDKYGILVNPTQEEIDATIVKRLSEFEFSDWWLSKVDDKYLSEVLRTRKAEYINSEAQKAKLKIESDIKQLQSQLEALTAKRDQ